MTEKQLFRYGCGGMASFALLVFFGPCLLSVLTGGIAFSDGYREGKVQKFSVKGLVWKTREGELALPGLVRQGEAMTNVFPFTASDPQVIAQLERLHADETVRLRYQQVLLCPPWKSETGYFITRVERLH